MQSPKFEETTEESTPDKFSFVLKAIVLLVLTGIALLAAAFVFLPDLRESITSRWVEPTVPPPPSAPYNAELPPLARPLRFTADFEQELERWDQSLTRVIDGAYEIQVDQPNYPAYGLYLADARVSTFEISADVYQVAGDPATEYGVRFRQIGPNTYTMFSLSSTGYYRLIEVTENTYQELVPWTFDSRINEGLNAVNKIELRYNGSRFSAWVNGARLISRWKLESRPGHFAFGLTTFDTGNAVVRFDNFQGEVDSTQREDDFSNAETSQWSIGGAMVEDGTMELFTGPNLQLWQEPLPFYTSEVSDALIEVDAMLVRASSEYSKYGLIFGDTELFSYYTLFLSENGQVSLSYRYPSGVSTELLAPLSHSSIRTEKNAWNRLRIEVRGQEISISINDTHIKTVESLEPILGSAGMIVDAETQARFDNFRIEER